ncbi:hypothetical protein J6590_029027 [Homalodisca vitripennis]|nr:hypothetical protein J6590_029027 [Homalodisca vitripennis]
MSLTALPVEALEEILHFLDVEDIVNVWKGVGIDVSESFWARLCKRKGYIGAKGDEESWKSVIQCAYNWRSKNLIYREYMLGFNLRPLPNSPRSLISKQELHYENILSLDFNTNKLKIVNINSTPMLVKSIKNVKDVKYFETSGSKMLIVNTSLCTIYTLKESEYTEIFQTKLSRLSHSALSNDFFAFEDNKSGNVRVVDLTTLEEFEWSVQKDIKIRSMTICGVILTTGYVFDSNCYLGRYNIQDRSTVNNLFLSKGTVSSFLELNLFISTHLVVHRNIDDPKMFVSRTNGKCIKTFYYSGWLALQGEYIIYRKSHKIYIWTSKNPNDDTKELSVAEGWIYAESKIIFNSLLVLPFSKCFKVVEFQKAVYLYDVNLETSSFGTSRYLGSRSFVNQYYYVLMEVVIDSRDEDFERNSNRLSTFDATSSSDFKSAVKYGTNQPLHHKVVMIIYDFRNNAEVTTLL